MPFAWDDGCATGAAAGGSREAGAVHFKRGPCLSEAIPIKNDNCKQDGSKPAPNEQHLNMLYDRKQKLHPCRAKKAMNVGWEGGYAT